MPKRVASSRIWPSVSARAVAWAQSFLDILFPPRCAGCNALGQWLCSRCQSELVWLEPPLCSRCGLPLPPGRSCAACLNPSSPYLRIRSATYFEGPIRRAVHRFKYSGRRALAGPLALLIYDVCEREGATVDAVVPVPLHPNRRRERGYNQTGLLAQELSKLIGKPMVESVLQRARHTVPQVGLTLFERRRNVRDAFQCQNQALRGQDVLLLDDVCTTGATLQAAAHALREGNVRKVWAITIARSRPTG